MGTRLQEQPWFMEAKRKRTLSADAATGMIREAVYTRSIVWVSQRDLLAPYNQHTRRRHEELCAVLRAEYDWPVHFQDFLSPSAEEPKLVTTRPLVLAEVAQNARLLIVGCYYKFDRRPDKNVDPQAQLSIAPDSVSFHLIKQVDRDVR